MDELEKLYAVVSQKGLYTKSFDEFKQKYSDPASQDKLFNVVSDRKLYTKSKDEFVGKYFPQPIVAEKKNRNVSTNQTSTSVSEDSKSDTFPQPISTASESSTVNNEGFGIFNQKPSESTTEPIGVEPLEQSDFNNDDVNLDLIGDKADPSDKIRIPSDDDFEWAQRNGYVPPNSEIEKTSVKESNTNGRLDFDNPWLNRLKNVSVLEKEEEKFNLYDLRQDGSVLEKEEEKFNPDDLYDLGANAEKNTVSKIEEKIKSKDLNLENPYLYYHRQQETQDNFVTNQFGLDKLKELNINPQDFDGFLVKNNLKQDFKNREQRGLFDTESESFSGDKVGALSYDMERFKMLSLYMADKNERMRDKSVLEQGKENPEAYITGEIKRPNNTTLFSHEKIEDMIKTQMPNLYQKSLEVDRENKEILQKHENGEAGWFYGGKKMVNAGVNALVDRATGFSATGYDFIGAEDTADEIRMIASIDELSRPDTREVVTATGKSLLYKGQNLIVDERGAVYDVDKKIRVTDTFTGFGELDKIRELAKNSKETDWIFSPQGALMQTSGVTADLLFQIALTKGMGGVLGGVSKGLNVLSEGAVTARRLATIENLGGSAVAQATMGYSSGYEDALSVAKEQGLNELVAKKLASDVGNKMALVYGATSFISPQTKATEAVFGNGKKDLIRKAFIAFQREGGEAYKKTFTQGLKNFGIKLGTGTVEFLEEGGKEVFQENIQQASEVYGINPIINEGVGSQVRQIDITKDDFINTSVLSFFSSGLMSQAKLSTFFNKNAPDRLTMIGRLSEDSNQFEQAVQPLIENRTITSEFADEIKKDVNNFNKQKNKVPQKLNPEVALSVMDDLQTISDLESKKKNLDVSFHNDINDEIQSRRKSINNKQEFSKLSKDEILKAKEQAIKELQLENNPSGEENFTLTDRQITERAVSNMELAKTQPNAETETSTNEATKPKVEETALNTDFDPEESEGKSLARLSESIQDLEGQAKQDEASRIAEEHAKSYFEYVNTQPNSQEILDTDFAKNFESDAYQALMKGDKVDVNQEQTSENGSRVDEQGNQVDEAEFLVENNKIDEADIVEDEISPTVELDVETPQTETKKTLFTGRKKKIKDFSKAKGEFIFFTENEGNAESYGETTEATVDTSNFLDLDSQKKKSEYVENLSDNEVSNIFDLEKKARDIQGRPLNNKSFNDILSELVQNKRDDIKNGDERLSGDGEPQNKFLRKIKSDGFDGVLLDDAFFGKNDLSYVVLNKSAINKEQTETTPIVETPSQQEETVQETVETEAEVKQPTLNQQQTKQNALVNARNQYNRLSNFQKRSKQGTNLKQTVLQLASDLDFTVSETNNKLSAKTNRGTEAGKIAFKEVIPNSKQEDIDFALEEINNGILLWDYDPFSPRIDLGISRADIRKGEADLLKDKTKTVPAKRLVEAIREAKNSGEYDYIRGSGGQIERSRVPISQITDTDTQLTREELDRINNEESQLQEEYAEWFENDLDYETQLEITEDYENQENSTGNVVEDTESGTSQENVRNEETPTRKTAQERIAISDAKIDDLASALRGVDNIFGIRIRVDNIEGLNKQGFDMVSIIADIAKRGMETGILIDEAIRKTIEHFKNNSNVNVDIDINKIKTRIRELNKQERKKINDAVKEAKKELTEKFKKKVRNEIDKKNYIQGIKDSLTKYINSVIDSDIANEISGASWKSMIRKVNIATTEHNLKQYEFEVDKIVANSRNKTLGKAIDKILSGKYTIRVGGKDKATRISNETRIIIQTAKDLHTSTPEVIQNRIDKLLTNSQDMDENVLAGLELALDISRARQIEAEYKNNTETITSKKSGKTYTKSLNTNTQLLESAVRENQRALENLQSQVETGRSELSEEVSKEANRLKNIAEEAIEATDHKEAGKTQYEVQKKAFDSKTKMFDAIKNKMKFDNFNLAKLTSFTFEYLLGYIDQKSKHGFGKIYDRFYKGKDGYIQRTNDAIVATETNHKTIVDALERILGRKMKGVFSGFLFGNKLNKVLTTGILVTKDGKSEELSLSKNQALYVHLISKMNTQNEQLRKQGWDDGSFQQLEDFLGDKYLEISDFITNFLSEKYTEYNKTYREIMRTDLGFEEGYFPTKYDKIDMVFDIDLAGTKFSLGSVMSNNMITKVTNNNTIDISQKAFEILGDYLDSMEHFHHFGRFTKDLNSMLNNKQFKNNVQSYDARAYSDFVKLSKAIIGDKTDFRMSNEESALFNFNAKIAAGYIIAKGYTALKQFLSLPAYTEFARTMEIAGYKVPVLNKIIFMGRMLANVASPYHLITNFNFMYKNSVGFRDRLKKGNVGNEVLKQLLKTGTKQTLYQNIIRKALKAGIAPNKFIDAITISTGGIVYYNQQIKTYKKNGLNDTDAKAQAIRDFEIGFKLTQQSADTANLSDPQIRKNALSSLFIPFKNAQFSYFRRIMANKNNILKRYQNAKTSFEKKGYKSNVASVKAFQDTVKKADTWEELSNILLYTHILPLIWQFVASGLPGLLTEWDDDDTDEMKRALYLGPIDGLAIASDFALYAYNSIVMDKNWGFDQSILINEYVVTAREISNAAKDAGEWSEEVIWAIAMAALKTQSIQTPPLVNIYEGVEDFILNNKETTTQEDIIKILNAPKAMIKKESDGKIKVQKRSSRTNKRNTNTKRTR